MAFKPGQSGNPHGRKKGVPDRRSRLRTLLEPHAEALINKAVDLALGGDPHALRLCLERLIPKAKDEPIDLPLTEELSRHTALQVCESIWQGLASKTLTPDEAKTLFDMIKIYRDTGIVDQINEEMKKIQESINSQ